MDGIKAQKPPPRCICLSAHLILTRHGGIRPLCKRKTGCLATRSLTRPGTQDQQPPYRPLCIVRESQTPHFMSAPAPCLRMSAYVCVCMYVSPSRSRYPSFAKGVV